MPDQTLISRRGFVRLGAALLSGVGMLLGGCASLVKDRKPPPSSGPADSGGTEGDGFDYVVIGSGAGGGPLAANLALEGFRVLLLEAGGEDEPCEYQVPAFHAKVSEHRAMSWDFFVRHYSDEAQQARDTKYTPERGGVLYPRAGTLGGCTAHNAMIFVAPHSRDWNEIAALTGDDSWRGEHMYRYFERLARSTSLLRPRGWLPLHMPGIVDLKMLLKDKVLSRIARAALDESHHMPQFARRLMEKLGNGGNPNAWKFVNSPGAEGLISVPLTTLNGQRAGSREFIEKVRKSHPDRLEVRSHALASRILLDETQKAVGVEYLRGAHLYRADPRNGEASESVREQVRVKREVIVAAGAFNTPQLLKLSGIGPKAELERHGIEVRVNLPGVGENLQDRYEVAVVTRLSQNIPLIKGMTLRCPAPGEEPDPLFKEWRDHRSGPYTANGAALAIMQRSRPELENPDLFIFGLTVDFHGYFPKYSDALARGENYFSWAVLKARTHNRGCVTLRSADPRDMPDINFHYFSEGHEGPGDREDLDAVVAGLKTARSINRRLGDLVAEEVLPGPRYSDDDLPRFVRNEAWGHHASCTCAMGPKTDPKAVVDSRFRVYGTQNLRIVDASVFPRIPGFFIVSAVYMISEKAKDVIIEDARLASMGHEVASG
jgi:choline dehydrogenase